MRSPASVLDTPGGASENDSCRYDSPESFVQVPAVMERLAIEKHIVWEGSM